MLFRNHALVAAMAALCTMFCAVPAHAEDDGDGGVYMQHSISGASVSTAPIRTVPLSVGAIYPAQYNGDVRDLPQVYTPPEYHTLNDFPTPMPQRTLPPGGEINAPQPPPIEYGPMPATLQNFAGLGFNTTVSGGQAGGGWPPDTNGDVGPTYYIQSVNTAYGIFDKSTGVLAASFKENQLWQGAGTGTVCDANHQGDPVVIHDGLADRWILTDFAFTFSGKNPQPPYYQCIAVSKTSDPISGGWYLYAVRMDSGATGAPPAGTFADYPKFGFWTDCMYMGANGFGSSGSYAGGIFAAFDRTTLFSGGALTGTNSSIGFTNDPNIFGMFPANMQAGNGSDSSKLPPSGTQEYFVVTSASIYGFDVRKFQANATACGAGATLSSPTSVAVASYGYPAIPSGTSNTTDIVRQPGGTSPKLDSLGDEIMQRVVYRNIAGTESLWLVHTTCGSTQSSAGVCSTNSTTTQPQWLQINVSGGTVNTTPVQQQIYAPDTTFYRWMGSLAVDSQGNMAVGYSRSNATSPNYPSLAYSGRLASDPLNQLPQTEVVMQAGAGSQTTYNRWGDYSAMTVDPSDDCTFWYTNEYFTATGTSWQTRIGSFKFPSCVAKQNQTITFPNPGPLTFSPSGTFALAATASSGLTVTYTSTTPSVCSVSGSTGTMLAAGTCTINADQAGNATYNAAPTVTDNITINKANQTINFTSTAPAGAVVGGPTYTVTATGGASGNAVTFTIDAASSGVCTISGSTVSFTGIGACTIDANQAGNASYNAAPQALQSFAVGKGNQTITFTSTAPAGAVVGGATYTVTATSSAGLTPVTFTIDASASSVCTISGNTVSFTSVGNCVIDANQAGNASYNAAPQAQQSFAVGKGSQTITFPNPGAQTYSSGGTFAVSATATSGLAVTFTSTTPSVCSVAGTTVTIQSGGTCSINADQSGNANYNAAPTVSDNITINPASQTISFPNPGAQTYSPSGTFAVSATATSGLAVTFTSTTPGVCTVSGSTGTMLAAGTCTINADQSGNGNYNAAATVADNITINPASQAITFTSTAPGGATVGGPTYTVTANGGASGNPVTFTIDASSSGVCTISGSTVSFTATGSCLIDANQAGNTNYAAAPQAQQAVSVGVASQTITFPNPGPATYSLSGTFGLTATASSGLTVTYVSNSTGVCTVAGSTASIVSAGTCSITASQSGNASYGAATPATDLITINPAGQTITFTSTPPAGPAYGGSYVVGANGGASGNPVMFNIDASSTAGACSISGATVSFTGTGACIVDANQAGNANYSAAVQQQQSFTIGAADQAITFTSTAPAPGVLGGPTYTVTATASSTLPVTLSIDAGSASVCTINGSASGSTVSFISTGTCTIDAVQAGNTNYNPAPQAQQSFTVDIGTLSLVFTTQPADVAQGTTQATIAVTEQNQYGYVVTGDNSSTVDFTVAACGGSVSLGSATMSNGVATLSNSAQRFYTPASGQAVDAASSGSFSGSASSNTFSVMQNPTLIFSDGFDGCRL